MPPSSAEELLITRLLQLPAAERGAAMDLACAQDTVLAARRQAIHALLLSGALLPVLPSGAEATRVLGFALAPTSEEISGARVGPYKLLQKIGEGGFGVVWMAEQLEPIRRQVAVKIIKLGMDTEEVIARFEAERQALALMEHPNIARVIDAGATASGRPYFVMELVRGIAITRYCDEARLPAEARLRLFITVCQAVQHAHQKGVIHRDLKPSNILVTLHDGVPVPKIIDFGIVKATSARLTEKTLFTQFHSFIGTPAYTSPEQMEMSGLDIDTRSDIYSLGVLLYELLTGHPPFDSDALVKSGLEAMRRTIREIDPPRPSNRLGTLPEVNRTSIAHQRSTDAGKLSLLLRGDLDWIAMRCLEKDRTRRYDSAASLATDIERHLSDDVVEARPPSRIYQTKKFVRRHRLAVFAAAGIAVTLVVGLVVSSALFVRERSAHGRATLAEKKEGELRQQAEVARTDEVKRAARTALQLANRHLADGKMADGLAYLVYAAHKDPQNAVLAPRLASVLTSHNFLLPVGAPFNCGSPVQAVRFSKDGRSIFIGTEDGVFRVLDASSGTFQREFRLGRDVILGGWEFAAGSDDVLGVRFADNTFAVLDAASGKQRWSVALDANVRSYTERPGLNHSAGLSPDGRWVYACANAEFWVWDAATGKIILHPSFQENVGSGIDLRFDGGEVALFAGDALLRWSLPDGRPVPVPIHLERPPNALLSSLAWTVRYSPDGKRLAVTNPLPGVQLFDAATGSPLRTFPPWDELVGPHTVGFGSNGRLFAAGVRTTGWWDVGTGKFAGLPVPAPDFLHPFTFDAAGSRLLSTGSDGFARVCDLPGGALAAELTWQQQAGFCAALSPDGTGLVVGNASGMLQRLRLGRTAAQPLTLPRPALPLMPAPFLPGASARLLWLTHDRARVIEVASGREVAGGFTYPEPAVEPVAFEWFPPVRADGKFMVVRTARGPWQAWELDATGIKHVATLENAPAGSATSLVFSARGDRVQMLSQGNTQLAVWDLHTGARAGPPFTLAAGRIPSLSPNLNPDGTRVAFATGDDGAMIVDVATARPTTHFKTRPLVSNLSVLFNPEGSRLVTANFLNEARLWDAATGEPLSPVIPTPGSGGGSRFSPDGRWFLTWGATSTRLWDGRTGARFGDEIPAGGKQVRFSADSRSLATCGVEGKAQVWDGLTGQALTEPLRHPTLSLVNPEFSADGRFLRTEKSTDVKTKGGEAQFYLWSVPPRLPDGATIPEWLLQLATVCATKVVNDAGQLVDVTDAHAQLETVRRQLAALPADAPLAEWGRWILDESAARPIAPGFTLGAGEAAQLTARFMAEATAAPTK